MAKSAGKAYTFFVSPLLGANRIYFIGKEGEKPGLQKSVKTDRDT